MKRGPVQISRGQPNPRCEVFEPNHFDENRMLAHTDTISKADAGKFTNPL